MNGYDKEAGRTNGFFFHHFCSDSACSCPPFPYVLRTQLCLHFLPSLITTPFSPNTDNTCSSADTAPLLHLHLPPLPPPLLPSSPPPPPLLSNNTAHIGLIPKLQSPPLSNAPPNTFCSLTAVVESPQQNEG